MPMKKSILGLVATGALIAGPAMAADLRMPVKAPPAPIAPVATWTGCYIGGNVGGAWAQTHITDVGNGAGAAFASAGVPGQQFTVDSSGIVGGGQIGCDWQMSNIVFGIEGDVGAMGIRGTALDPGTASNTRVGIDDGIYGDVTGRLGIAFGPALLYGRGGAAFYGGNEVFSTNSAAFISQTHVGTFTGWTAGVGIEYRLSGPWSAKLEYNHYDFGTQTFNVTATGGVFPFRVNPVIDAVTVGLNYRFNFGSPVAARY
jgi:outer membrane immunogenic protein